MKLLEIENKELNLKFTFKDFNNDTKLSDVYADLKMFFEHHDVQKHSFSETSFRRLMKTCVPVKGWTMAVLDPVKVNENIDKRRVAKREEKRLNRQAAKKMKRRQHVAETVKTKMPGLSPVFIALAQSGGLG